MPTLAHYRKFPHFETKLSTRMKYSVLHSQLCRFATRCTKLVFFEVAAAKLMSNMIDHAYDRRMLFCKLHNFLFTFFGKTPIFVRDSHLIGVQKSLWYRVEQEIERRVSHRDFNI